MNIGDRVKLKVNEEWQEGVIICVYAIPDDWSLLDIRLDNNEVIHGVNSRDVYGI